MPFVLIIVDDAFEQPLRFAFESLMINEFHTLNGTCTTLVPSGPGYENATLANQVCTTIGSQPGMATVPGDVYTYVSFGYSYSDLWRVCERRWDLASVMSTDD
jgi:ATP-binding cassette subfamily G (WHITE) protein 2 (SNQ2)